MAVNKIMTTQIITLSLDDDLSKAKDIFDRKNIHHIIITDGKKIAGIITDRDVFKHLSPNIGTKKATAKDVSLLSKKIHLIMSRDVITAPQDISLNHAVLLFFDNHISCLPIVDESNHPIGIISWRDIIKILALQYRDKMKKAP